MLTDHETRPDRDAPRDGEKPSASIDRPGDEAREARSEGREHFPALDEPSWLEDDLDDEMEAPRDSTFRGIWIGVAAAAATFVLVFAVPHWLGWYDLGKPGQVTHEPTPESVVSTVTAKSAPADEPRVETPPPPAAAPATARVTAPAAEAPAAAPPAPTADTPPRAPEPKRPARTKPPAPTPVAAKASHQDKPAKTAASTKRTYSVQIAAFKSAKQANRLAERVKRDGYRADVRRVESSPVPWVVRVGGYSSREQAESARDALARKGFKGFII